MCCVITNYEIIKVINRLFIDLMHSIHSIRFNCRRCILGKQIKCPPSGSDCNSDLVQWNHSTDKKTISDPVLKSSWDKSLISFVFHHHSHEKQRQTV